MKRNYSIDTLKLFFALSIALGHYGLNTRSGIIVNCFFIMSGYYLVQSYDSAKYLDGFSYIKTRIKRIYPYYSISLIILILTFTFEAFLNGNGISYFYSVITSCLPEFMLIQNIGIFSGGINYPLWQMCTLLIASYILFSLMCINKTLTANVLSPLIAIMGSTYFANAFETHDIEYWGLIGSFISAPLLRAFTGLCIGISLYNFLTSIVNYLEKKSSFFSTMVSTFSIFYFGINCYLGNTFQSVISFVLVFATFLCSNGVISFTLNRNSFKSFEKLSLSIYVNHALIIIVSNFLTKNRVSDPIAICIYIVLLLVYSIIFMKIVDFLILKLTKQY